LFVNTAAFSQSFFGDDVDLYLNTVIKPKEISEGLQKFAYKNFYLKFDTVAKVLTEDFIGRKRLPFKPFQIGEYPHNSTSTSDYSELVGTEFVIEAIYKLPKKYEFLDDKYYVFKLTNPELGTYYYKYDSEYEHNMELDIVRGLVYPADYWCKDIDKEVDKFNGKTRYSTPEKDGLSMVKVIMSNDTTYFIHVRNGGSTVNVGVEGMILLFDDGSKIEKKSAEVDVKTGKYSYVYSAFEELNSDAIMILCEKLITDTRLYIYDNEIDKDNSILIQEYLKCLVSGN
jgi:hypothetical protein